MIRYKEYLKRNWYAISFGIIILLAIFLRFYNYDQRWILASDQARDILIVRFALFHHKIPMTGPFASAGQFIYGPQWYWLLMLMESLSFFSIIGPWVIATLLSVGIVYLMILIGKEIMGEKVGLIAGLFAAISIDQLAHSASLTQPAMVGIFAAISLYYFVRVIKYKKLLDTFLLGFFVGNSINIHFQAIGLLSLIPISMIVGKRSFKNYLFLLLGFGIPFIPLLVFDFRTNFFESRNMLDYYLHGQYKIYVSNSWRLYLFSFWPSAWSNIIGGDRIMGAIIMLLTVPIFLYSLLKKELTPLILSVIACFILIFIELRFFRGELFSGYLFFLHPFVFLFSAIIVYQLGKINKIVGILFMILVTFFTLKKDIQFINNSHISNNQQFGNLKNILVKKYPNNNFSIYDYKYKTSAQSLSLVYFLDYDNKTTNNGVKIGSIVASKSANMKFTAVYGVLGGFQLYDLRSSTSAELAKAKWILASPERVYKDVVEWYIK